MNSEDQFLSKIYSTLIFFEEINTIKQKESNQN
jgi:hypothetical protein